MTIATVKSTHHGPDSIANFKQFFVIQSFPGDVILAISEVEDFLKKEVYFIKTMCSTKKSHGFFSIGINKRYIVVKTV